MSKMKLNNLIESARIAKPGITLPVALRTVEAAIDRAVDTCGKGTEQEQKTYLEMITEIDNAMAAEAGVELFKVNERLKKAYPMLSEAPAEKFWNGGLAKLREVRTALWGELEVAPVHA